MNPPIAQPKITLPKGYVDWLAQLKAKSPKTGFARLCIENRLFYTHDSRYVY